MWNVLLDPLPEDWKGYPIDTDFQTGIQIIQCMNDDDLSVRERFYTALNLLFPERVPDNAEAEKALSWYLNEYHHDNNAGESFDAPVMDFDTDQWRIYAAFLSQYNIDLNTAKMHWFTFMGLLSNLNECSFTSVMDIRNKKINSKMSPEERKSILKAKKVFAIKPKKQEKEELTLAEQQAVEEFVALINKK